MRKILVLILFSLYLLLTVFLIPSKIFALTYCGVGETYDYYSDSCKCSYGYVRSYYGCISEDQYCKNEYGYGAKASFSGKCECNSGYILNNGRCELGSLYCSSNFGIHANFDFLSQSCECNSGYITNSQKNKCITLDEKCEEEYGNNAKSESTFYNKYSALDCGCKDNYLWNSSKTSCIDADTRCYEVLGSNSTYNSISEKCECESGSIFISETNSCISEDDYCESQIGEDSTYTGNYECECDSGFLLDPDTNQCMSETDYCERELENSHYEGNFECTCNDTYVLDKNSNECVEEETYCENYMGPNSEYIGDNECDCVYGYHEASNACEKDTIIEGIKNNSSNKLLWVFILLLTFGGLVIKVKTTSKNGKKGNS